MKLSDAILNLGGVMLVNAGIMSLGAQRGMNNLTQATTCEERFCMYTHNCLCQHYPYTNSLLTLKQQWSNILLKHRPLDYSSFRLEYITRAWHHAIAHSMRGQPACAYNFCHMTIIRKWFPDMGMLSSASTFCIFEKMLRCCSSRSYAVVIRVDM